MSYGTYLEKVWTSIPIPAQVIGVTRVLRISTSIAERCATAEGQLFVQREVFTLKLSYDDVKLEDR